MNVLERIEKGLFYLDGGTGSRLQERGLKPGELPELWNIEHPEVLIELARDYYEAGSNAVLMNTFGANRLKFTGNDGMPSVEDVVIAAFKCTDKARKEAAGELVQEDRYVALDVGPLGRLLEPLGDLPFEEAVDIFKETIIAGVKAGADYIFIETMNDAYETKAAVIAAKENSDLPVFVSNVYDESSRLMTGANPAVMTALLEGLRVNAEGANCSLGPRQMKELVPKLYDNASLPLIVKPNAGMPRTEDGKTVYDVEPDEFASLMADMVESGARLIGGCCGTTPEHIRKLVLATKDIEPLPVVKRDRSAVTSFAETVEFKERPILIGERINPTGKKKFKEALRNSDIPYILKEGLDQEKAGADILDVNVGLPEIDEPAMLRLCVTELQGVTALPLQLDSSDPVALEGAMRIYNGKPMINSVNGKKEVMDAVFPLVAKYGGLLVCLTLDEDGIPETAKGRFEIAKRIMDEAACYGIERRDLIFDPLAMAVSAQADAAKVTLDAVAMIHDRLDALTSLGVSNISFGLPRRDVVTSAFFVMAMERGLSAAIMNPFSVEMMKAYHSFLALKGLDEGCAEYIEMASGLEEVSVAAGGSAGGVFGPAGSGAAGCGAGGASGSARDGAAGTSDKSDLTNAIIKGLKEDAAVITKALLDTLDPLEIIDGHIIPALDEVGDGFEKKRVFLPQLLMSAEAAKFAFDEVKTKIGSAGGTGPKVVIATVKGDIHDIGKNIVKVLLENYGYSVIDLGKDVPPDTIADCVIKNDIKLVGLSALMTTTVPAMEETIKLLRDKKPDCRVVVGGAVLTKEYSDMIGADYYGRSAMDTVRYAEQVFA